MKIPGASFPVCFDGAGGAGFSFPGLCNMRSKSNTALAPEKAGAGAADGPRSAPLPTGRAAR